MKAIESSPTPLRGAQVWPLSVAAYHALGEAGLIPKNTELLYGFVYRKMPESPYHFFLAQLLQCLLVKAAIPGLLIRSEKPIVCEDSEPEPDLSVVKATKDDYRFEHPHTAERVIEICVTSHDYDRSKCRAYAGAGVKELWLVLAPEKQIEAHCQPQDGQYAEKSVHGPGGQLASSVLPQFKLNLDELFSK